jgi:hypothetical protein
VGMVVIVDEFGDGVVVSSSEHSTGCIFFVDYKSQVSICTI